LEDVLREAFCNPENPLMTILRASGVIRIHCDGTTALFILNIIYYEVAKFNR